MINPKRIKKSKALALLILCFSISACVRADIGLHHTTNTTQAHTKTVYVVSHGWHTGLVVAIDDIPNRLIPEKSHYKNVRFLEIGWGDSGFYQTPKITIPLTLKALFIPTKSVMHVVGFSDHPATEFPYSEIIALELSDNGMNRMLEAIDSSFDRNYNGAAPILREGLYGRSHFYRAKGRYHALNTCNNWTGRMLKKGGIPISNAYTASAGNIISQTHMRGTIIRMLERPPILSK